MNHVDKIKHARVFLMDAILCGNQKWTKARERTLEEAIKHLPKDVGNLKRDFMLIRNPPIPLNEDGGLDVEVAKLLLVAVAARGGYWHEFIDGIKNKFGPDAYADVIIGFKDVAKYYRLCSDDRAYLIFELIRNKYFQDKIVAFVSTGYFASSYNSPKIKYIRALGKEELYDALSMFDKSRAEYVQVELAAQLPVEELIYKLNMKSQRAKAIIEGRLDQAST